MSFGEWISPGRRVLFLGFLILASLTLASCDEPQQPFVGKRPLEPHKGVESRFLHQKGRQIVGPDGVPRILRTMNIGGWLHWESWMFGGGLDLKRLDLGSESQLLSRFQEYYGVEATRRFQQEIYRRYMTRKDLDDIARRGFDSVRLPINHTLLESEEGWQLLRRVVGMIGEAGLGVFLDMHAAPGGQSKIFTADPDEVLLWEDPKLQDQLVSMWGRLAREYRDNPTVYGYDLLNEPVPEKPSQLLDLYTRLIAAIRKHDKEHLIVLEGSGLSRDFNLFEQRLDENMAYSPHVYLWVGWPDAKWLKRLENLSRLHDTPVWVGEFGEDLLPDVKKLRLGFDKLNGWAIWSWKRVEGGIVACVNHFPSPPAWKKLIASLHPTSKARPVMTQEEAFAALSTFLDASENYSPYPGMAQALGVSE